MKSSTTIPDAMLNRRPIVESDMEFLLELYATTRYDIARSELSDAERAQLIEMQFVAQHQHYQVHFRDATFEMIELDGQPIGRLYVVERENEIRAIDLALLPEYRKLGVGSALLVELQERAVGAGLPLRLRVERDNPALQLYQRLGFRVIADEGVNFHLEWTEDAS